MGELPKLINALVILALGWGLKDSFDRSLKQRELDLSYAKELRELLQIMGDPNSNAVTLTATARVIASFGPAAIAPLLGELSAGRMRGAAAASGLRILGLTHPRELCAALPNVLGRSGRLFAWQDQLEVVRILGEAECREAVPMLKAYKALVEAAGKGSTAALQAHVLQLPLSPQEDYPALLEDIDATLGALEAP
ncbi:MAG: hypothetical protein QM767_24650 [Anaeromyxobacter sp.]